MPRRYIRRPLPAPLLPITTELERRALADVALSLSPQNENVARGDLIAAIRDLRQVALTNQELLDEYDRRDNRR
jgi:hypothetical protein